MMFATAVAAVALLACSNGDDVGQPIGQRETAPTTSPAGDNASETPSDGIAADNIDSAEDNEEENASELPAAPARRVPAQQSDEATHWVGHGTMTEEAIEIAWSEVEGEEVVHQIFRFDSVGLDPETVALTTPIHEGVDTLGWTDDSVEAGTFYTYVMRVIADDEVLERRWTDTLAATDTTPPPDITGLTAVVVDGDADPDPNANGVATKEVLLEWDPGSDDVEFGSYGVFRTDLADEPQYVGGGGDLGVTSFVDNDIPPSGEIGYEVVAFDFHGNRSDPISITIEIP